jgi:E3 ubiquitin-protein ligase HUWE1
VHHFFVEYGKDESAEGKVRWMKISHRFQLTSPEIIARLTLSLDELLTKYRPNRIAEIGTLLDILAPRDIVTGVGYGIGGIQSPPINISTTVYSAAPEFWDIVAKHQTRLTDMARAHPELVPTSLNFVIRYPILVDVALKIALFQQTLRANRPGSDDQFGYPREMVALAVTRATMLPDSVKLIVDLSPERLMDAISVTFRGEEGVDAGGVTRDWFGSLSNELFGTAANLFVPTANGTSLQVNRHSGTTPDVLRMFRFAGKFMALAIVHQTTINAHLTTSLYKFLIGSELSLRDMEQIDESVARSIGKILVEPVDGLMLDFTVGAVEDGKPVSVELKPGGADIPVTEENKIEYVQLRLNYYFRSYASVQISAFLDGFFEMIPQKKLEMFTPEELDLVTCGIPEIDIEDLQKNCRIIEPYTRRHPVIQAFFSVLRNWKSDDLARLLQFVTGSSQVPAGGFGTFASQGRPFAIAPGGDEHRLPVAHVCANQLDLPPYPSESMMSEKLLCAVRNCSGFGFA